VPVVHVGTFTAMSFKNGSSYAADFKIIDWVARRREFIEAANETAPAAPAAKANVAPDHQAPIAATAATDSVDPDDSDFLKRM